MHFSGGGREGGYYRLNGDRDGLKLASKRESMIMDSQYGLFLKKEGCGFIFKKDIAKVIGNKISKYFCMGPTFPFEILINRSRPKTAKRHLVSSLPYIFTESTSLGIGELVTTVRQNFFSCSSKRQLMYWFHWTFKCTFHQSGDIFGEVLVVESFEIVRQFFFSLGPLSENRIYV